MQVKYNKTENEWTISEVTEEESEILIDIGKDELMKTIALQAFQRFLPTADVLSGISKDEMGQA